MACFLDTNILLYAISTANEEIRKRDIAHGLLEQRDCVLSVQVLQEFLVQSTRVTRADRLSLDMATGFIRAWRRFPVQDNSLALFDRALDIHRRDRFSFWDSAIIAAAVMSGCDTLLTEDMDDGRHIDGVTIHNPFRLG